VRSRRVIWRVCINWMYTAAYSTTVQTLTIKQCCCFSKPTRYNKVPSTAHDNSPPLDALKQKWKTSLLAMSVTKCHPGSPWFFVVILAPLTRVQTYWKHNSPGFAWSQPLTAVILCASRSPWKLPKQHSHNDVTINTVQILLLLLSFYWASHCNSFQDTIILKIQDIFE